jgi:hypothetical protein
MMKHLNASTYSFTIPSSQLKVLQQIGTMKEYMEAFKVLVTGSHQYTGLGGLLEKLMEVLTFEPLSHNKIILLAMTGG